MKAKLLLFIALVLPAVSAAQTVDKQKVQTFASAVAKAEGFGVPRAIPTRYHNPGNIRSRLAHAYPGQIGLNRCGYVIFKNDRYGWLALENQLTLMASGQSAYYGADMTINKVAKIYATGWRLWSKNVSTRLGVPPTITLAEFFAPESDEPPTVEVPITDFPFTLLAFDNDPPSSN